MAENAVVRARINEKIKEEARYDGKWVIRTNTNFSAECGQEECLWREDCV